MKKCFKCGEEKIIDEFYTHHGMSDGHLGKCKDCTRKLSAARNKIKGVWSDMIRRCYNKNRKEYYRYGGRGITVCVRWMNFENFIEDMGERPVGMSLDRIDNLKGYSKDNCRWATPKEQANNRRSNRIISINGEQMTIAQYAEKLNLPYQKIWKTMNHCRVQD